MGKEKILHYAAIKGWQEFPLVQKYRDIHIHSGIRNSADCFALDIIIPHYNNIKGLKDTLNSIDFHITPICVTVIDDCSTERDGFEDLKKDFPMVRFLQMEKNSGPGAARQKGIENTYYPYIMFIDAGDCIASRTALLKVIKSIPNYSQAYVFSYVWWNGDGRKYFKKDSTLLPGKIFKREFIELYHLHFNTTPECSYSNEDRGFMAPCKIVLEHIASYDKTRRLYFNSDVLYKRILDENSITQADNGSFYYYKHIPGLVHNAEHIVNICRENNLHWKYPARIITYYLVYLYECYLKCAKECPEQLPANLEVLKYFYKHVYKQFELINEKMLEGYYSRAIRYLIKYSCAAVPRINIRRFLGEIKND